MSYYMYSDDERAKSEETYSTLSAMETDRVMYCVDWHHWKEWEKNGEGTFVVYDLGMCENPAQIVIPNGDYVPVDAVALIL